MTATLENTRADTAPASESPTEHSQQGPPSNFSRVTSSGRFIPEIDGFRFFAIFGVFIAHDLWQVIEKNRLFLGPDGIFDAKLLSGPDKWLFHLLGTGGVGVQFFFVISGFILALPFAEHHLRGKQKPSLKTYLWRRVTRLEPPYLVNMTILAVAVLFYKNISPGESLLHYLASIFYVHNQVYESGSILNNVAWSLEVEIQFYLLAPFLTLLFTIRNHRRRRFVLATLVLIFSLFNGLFAPASYRYQTSLLNAIQYFLTGLLLADIYILNPGFLLQKNWRWDLLAIPFVALVCGSLIWGGGMWGPLTSHLPFCMLVLYIAGFKGRFLNRLLSSAPIFLIGGMCYTIYLYHGHLTSLLAILFSPLYLQALPLWLNYGIQFLAHAVIILSYCVIFFLLVERPCMQKNWPQKLWRRVLHRPIAQGPPPLDS